MAPILLLLLLALDVAMLVTRRTKPKAGRKNNEKQLPSEVVVNVVLAR